MRRLIRSAGVCFDYPLFLSLSLGEAPGTNRLEIVGTKGRLVAEATPQILANARDPGGGAGGALVFTKNKIDTDAGLRGEGSVGPVQSTSESVFVYVCECVSV